jgi:hypothetical protein
MEIIRFYSRKNTKNRLPEGKNGNNGPENGTIIDIDYYSRKIKQIRTYDSGGKPIKDIDFGHDHNGAGDPHAHDWDYLEEKAPNKTKGAARPITEEEKSELGKTLKEICNIDAKLCERQQCDIDVHDEIINEIIYRRSSIWIKTNNHVIAMLKIVDIDLNNLCLQNMIFDIEISSCDMEKQYDENKVTYNCNIKAEPIEVVIRSSIGIYGTILCRKLMMKSK